MKKTTLNQTAILNFLIISKLQVSCREYIVSDILVMLVLQLCLNNAL